MLSVKNDRTYGAPTVNKIRHCSYIFFFFFHLYYNSLYVSIESFSIFLFFFFPHNNPYRVSLSGSKRTNCAKIIRIKIATSKRNLYLYFKAFSRSEASKKARHLGEIEFITSTIYHFSITLYQLLYHSSTISILSNSILLNSISNNELFAFFNEASIHLYNILFLLIQKYT